MGHIKGARYEREFAKQLSRWWTLGLLEDVFWRTPISGGKATATQSSVQLGDISAVREIGLPLVNSLVIELKRGYPPTILLEWLVKDNSLIHQWWQKGLSQAQIHNRRFLLVVKHDRFPGYLITNAGDRFVSQRFLRRGHCFCLPLEDLWKQNPREVAKLWLKPGEFKRYRAALTQLTSSTSSSASQQK